MDNKENFLERYGNILLSTLITGIIILITFAFSGLYPFGENSILKVDLYHQYAPFHEEFREKLLSGDSLFYSWKGGLGKEFLSQIAYYTSSPISFLILLFPTKYISEAILLFVFLKICLCAFTFSYYLKKSYNKNNLFLVIFGIMYAFMAYITSFYWNIMWLDSIYLFPIVVLGIDRLVRDGSYKTYVFSLMVCIIVNFYIAFLVCVFATLYFLVKVFSEYSVRAELKIIFNRFVKFGVLSLLAGGVTMFLAIPTVVALGRTNTSDAVFPAFKIYENIYQIFVNHFSGANPVVLARNEDLPNIYSGVLTMVLLPVYFFNRDIKLKEKILFLVLILFMLLCSVLKQLDFIIHGNHFPANLPHRYTFIYSFVIISLAYKAFVNIKGIKPAILWIFFVIYSALLIFIEGYLSKIVNVSRSLSNLDILTNILLILVYTGLLLYYKKFDSRHLYAVRTKDNKKISNLTSILFVVFEIVLLIFGVYFNTPYFKEDLEIPYSFYGIFIFSILVIVITGVVINLVVNRCRENYKNIFIMCILLFIIVGESSFNSIVGFAHSGTTNRENFVKYIPATEEILDYIEETDTDENKFFRQEFSRFTAINESTMYNYNGFSIFSSMAYGGTSNLIQSLGIASTSNSYRYYDPTPLIDSMFNIKYIMVKDGTLNNENYEFIKNFDNVNLYENKTPLSLGFMVNGDILDWDIEQDTPFITQNEFVYKATDILDDILEPFVISGFSATNVDIENKNGKESEFTYKLHDETNLNLIPTINVTVINPKTQRLFFYIDSANSKRFKYTVNGHLTDREISTGRSLIDLGVVEAGTSIDIEFSLDRKGSYDKTYSRTGSFKLYGAGFNQEVFADVYDELQDEMVIVSDYTSTSINGTITAKDGGIMYTSIPYDEGFTVYVDGIKTDIVPIGTGLIGVPLSKGTHDISFKYYPKGFSLGITLSIVSIIGICVYVYVDKKLKNNKTIV